MNLTFNELFNRFHRCFYIGLVDSYVRTVGRSIILILNSDVRGELFDMITEKGCFSEVEILLL